MQLFKTPHIQFLKYKYVALGVTAVIVLAGLINITALQGAQAGRRLRRGHAPPDHDPDAFERGRYPRPPRPSRTWPRARSRARAARSREFQIRAMESVNTRAAETDQLEAHEALADKVIAALRGDDGKAEKARGLVDLNRIDEKSLTALLERRLPRLGPRRGPEGPLLPQPERDHRRVRGASPGSASSPRSRPS